MVRTSDCRLRDVERDAHRPEDRGWHELRAPGRSRGAGPRARRREEHVDGEHHQLERHAHGRRDRSRGELLARQGFEGGWHGVRRVAHLDRWLLCGEGHPDRPGARRADHVRAAVRRRRPASRSTGARSGSRTSGRTTSPASTRRPVWVSTLLCHRVPRDRRGSCSTVLASGRRTCRRTTCRGSLAEPRLVPDRWR